jgi:ABC-type multidrug transport system ATPase subunit
LKEAMHQRVGDFSKGMKMRLNFCRAFLHRPFIVFLDEPPSGLDPVNITKMKAFLRKQKEAGKTILITTHDMAFAESVCDRVAFMVDGDIALIDSPQALKVKMGEPVVQVTYLDNGEIKIAGDCISCSNASSLGSFSAHYHKRIRNAADGACDAGLCLQSLRRTGGCKNAELRITAINRIVLFRC